MSHVAIRHANSCSFEARTLSGCQQMTECMPQALDLRQSRRGSLRQRRLHAVAVAPCATPVEFHRENSLKPIRHEGSVMEGSIKFALW